MVLLLLLLRIGRPTGGRLLGVVQQFRRSQETVLTNVAAVAGAPAPLACPARIGAVPGLACGSVPQLVQVALVQELGERVGAQQALEAFQE